ncbi:MAG: outer membrane protein assembly factor BamE [Acetobacteraceae bacterium]
MTAPNRHDTPRPGKLGTCGQAIAPLAGGRRVPSPLSRHRTATVLAGALALCGCSLFQPPVAVRGNHVDPAELSRLVPGTTTEAAARGLLGSPTARGTFDPNRWYYIAETTRQVIGGTQGVLDQGVVVLNFNSQGVLQHVDRISRTAALSAPIVGRTTPTPGGSAGFFQQLIGNIGSVGPNVGQNEGMGGGAAPLQ